MADLGVPAGESRLGKPGVGAGGPHLQPAVGGELQPVQSGQAGEAEHVSRPDDAFLEGEQQALAAGHHLGLRAMLGEVADGIGQGGRLQRDERRHRNWLSSEWVGFGQDR